jgi:hypothetical protein
MFIETNLLLEDNYKEGDFIAYSSDWISIKELSDYKNILNAVNDQVEEGRTT